LPRPSNIQLDDVTTLCCWFFATDMNKSNAAEVVAVSRGDLQRLDD